MKEIYKNIFAGDVILPRSPLRSLNSYIIRTDDHALIIDSGFDHPESEECFFAALEELGIKKGQVDLYLTHLHADHSGLTAKFQQKYGGKVYCSAIDAEYVNGMAKSDYFDKQLYSPEFLGLYNDGHFFDRHPAVLYSPKTAVEFVFVKEGDRISIGDYEFEVIDLPGHT
ncbi:MAG: MBL fold metallo-hydrolase, partial [Peptostreptococcaceae bacterium]|nr:MBL fold metallo-hydrolase [Peptostreptococcaceae bacterium]